jgi:excisionase family DNA binding protein
MITVGEAALILNLNLQTIYRKIKRGEIRCVRIGRTVRLRQEDLFTASTEPSKARSVPNALLSLFWDADTKSLTSHDEVVIERVLEQGDLGAIRWLLESCDRSRLLKFLNGKGQRRLSKKSLNFWSLYFDQASFRNPRERTEDSLGKN